MRLKVLVLVASLATTMNTGMKVPQKNTASGNEFLDTCRHVDEAEYDVKHETDNFFCLGLATGFVNGFYTGQELYISQTKASK